MFHRRQSRKKRIQKLRNMMSMFSQSGRWLQLCRPYSKKEKSNTISIAHVHDEKNSVQKFKKFRNFLHHVFQLSNSIFWAVQNSLASKQNLLEFIKLGQGQFLGKHCVGFATRATQSKCSAWLFLKYLQTHHHIQGVIIV